MDGGLLRLQQVVLFSPFLRVSVFVEDEEEDYVDVDVA